MPKQLLHRLRILSICFEQGDRSVSERVTADLAGDTRRSTSKFNMSPIQMCWASTAVFRPYAD
jgi:hypothetical protein